MMKPQFLTASVCAAMLFCFLGTPAFAASSLSQYGITWTFDRDRQVGQYVNGDWWVVGPVTIVNITPHMKMNGRPTT